MKWLYLFEDFRNNVGGDLITNDNIIDCIVNGGLIYATIIKDFPGNDPKEGLRPVDIDNDGLITVLIDGSEHYIDIKNVEKVEI